MSFQAITQKQRHLDMKVRLYKAAGVLMVLLSLAACSTAPDGCYWPQSSGSGCHEVFELSR